MSSLLPQPAASMSQQPLQGFPALSSFSDALNKKNKDYSGQKESERIKSEAHDTLAGINDFNKELMKLKVAQDEQSKLDMINENKL